MLRPLIIALILPLINGPAAADLVARAEAAPMQLTDGTLVPRVVRDDEGHVIRLVLSDMELSPGDVAELGDLWSLRSLVLWRTNFTDDDVAQLLPCRNLEHLNLTSTQITDEVIDTLLKFEALRTVCLADVEVSANAIAKLEDFERNRVRGQRFRWGYSPRKQ